MKTLRLRGPEDSKCQSWDSSPDLSDRANIFALWKAESILVCEEFLSCVPTLGIETQEPEWERPDETACLVTRPPKVKCEASAVNSVALSLCRLLKRPRREWWSHIPSPCPHRTYVSRRYTPTQRNALSHSTHSHIHTLTPLTSKALSQPLSNFSLTSRLSPPMLCTAQLSGAPVTWTMMWLAP